MSHQFLFYLHPEGITGDQVHFDSYESHHIHDVLRLHSGEQIQATDGEGNRYCILLGSFKGGLQKGKIERSEKHESQSPLPVTLAMPCLKNERWQTALEGACELGLETILPIDYNLSVTKWTDQRLERAQCKSIEILKQCGGSYLTKILSPLNLSKALTEYGEMGVLYADQSGRRLQEIKVGSLVVVGPEAGFDEREIASLKKSGASCFCLTKRRLRSEIAVIAAISQLALKLGGLA